MLFRHRRGTPLEHDLLWPLPVFEARVGPQSPHSGVSWHQRAADNVQKLGFLGASEYLFFLMHRTSEPILADCGSRLGGSPRGACSLGAKMIHFGKLPGVILKVFFKKMWSRWAVKGGSRQRSCTAFPNEMFSVMFWRL